MSTSPWSSLVAILNPFDKKMKELRTLKQHYYPEGGWGWIIVIVTLCVQVISHGLQLGLAMYVMEHKSAVISRRLLNNASVAQSGKQVNSQLRFFLKMLLRSGGGSKSNLSKCLRFRAS